MLKETDNSKVADFTKESVHSRVPDSTKESSYEHLLGGIAGCFSIENEWEKEQFDDMHNHLRHNHGKFLDIIEILYETLDDIDEKLEIIREQTVGETVTRVTYDARKSILTHNGEDIHLMKSQEGKLIRVMFENLGKDLSADFIVEELNEIGLDLKSKLETSSRDSVVEILLDIWGNASRGRFSFLFESNSMVKKTDPILQFRCEV